MTTFKAKIFFLSSIRAHSSKLARFLRPFLITTYFAKVLMHSAKKAGKPGQS